MSEASVEALRERIEARREAVKSNACKFYGTLRDMDPGLREAVLDWMSDKAVSSRVLAESLADIGFPIAAPTIARHRNSECTWCKRHPWQ